jgi:alkanesulfonate monooxygenase SsuD/methylene tetrahydromethanopterin reductase-like flavin-dependent oxidoreductase (luciferase family)
MEIRREVIVRLAERAEDLGYAGFFVAEGWGHDSTALLAEIAVRTSRITIGSNVLNVWGRSPATIAMAAASLADLTGGRFVLGLGAGSPALAEGLHGKAFDEPVQRLEEVVGQVRGLLDGGRAEGAPGSSVPPLRLAITPAARVAIAVAALGPRALGVAGRLADAWTPFFLPRSGLPGAIDQIRAAAAGGRPEGAEPMPSVWPGIPAAVSEDPDQARTLAAWWITFYCTRMGPLYPNLLRRCGFVDAVDAVTGVRPGDALPDAAEVLVDELTLCGTAEHARSQLDRWYTAGADLPCLVLSPNADPIELEAILTALAPSTSPSTPS